MNAYEIVRDVHPLGSPLRGKVIARSEVSMRSGWPGGHLTLRTASRYRSIVPYTNLQDDPQGFDASALPEIGDEIDTVVANFVDETLILTAEPSRLTPEAIAQWRDFYEFVDTLTIGARISGTVQRVEPFGLFVDLGAPYVGLIDIGHAAFSGGERLPFDDSTWPRVGDRIECVIGYIRFSLQQIGLGWVPPDA